MSVSVTGRVLGVIGLVEESSCASLPYARGATSRYVYDGRRAATLEKVETRFHLQYGVNAGLVLRERLVGRIRRDGLEYREIAATNYVIYWLVGIPRKNVNL